MRAAPLVFAIALAGCGAGPASDTDDTDARDDGTPAVVYTRPLAGGETTTEGIEPHSAVFGTTEYVDAPAQELPVGPDPRHVHLGFPDVDTSRSVSLVWSTDTGTLASQVQLARGADLAPSDFGAEHTYEGISYLYGGSDDDAYRTHEFKTLGTLEPGTTYSYRVGGEGDGASHWSPIHSFTTPQAPGSSGALRVVFVGDSRDHYEDWGALLAQVDTEAPDLILFTGDLVESGLSEGQWYAWWEATGDVLARRPLIPALGNHEYLATNYFARFSLPRDEQYFDLRVGPLHVAALVDYFVDESVIDVDQPDFVEERLGGSDALWKLALNHVATYAVCERHKSNERLRDAWTPSFDAVGLDLSVSGHNHIYERSVPIRDGVEDPDGTVYLVTGGAGAPLYDKIGEGWWNVEAKAVMHYVVADFTDDGATITAKDIAGNRIDDFVLAPRSR
ncbi:MAG: metallophosphoesterase [Alphaproteobacteria bacterium]|nr:metallophosphoesterase [Alphaproteobacteria bacterium]